MYTLLLLVVLIFLVMTTAFMDILKALLLFALGFYLGKHWMELDLQTLTKAERVIARVDETPV